LSSQHKLRHKKLAYRGNKEWVERHGIEVDGCCKISREKVPGSLEVQDSIWVDYLHTKEYPQLKAQR
jgi:hypothetical protein